MPDSNDGQQKAFYPLLMRATAGGDVAVLSDLLSSARRENQLDDNLMRICLQNAAKKGHEAAARLLLEHGAKTDITGSKGSPALHWAAVQPQTKGHLAVARLLLLGKYEGCPANMEWRDEHGATITMAAAVKGHHEMLKLLLQCGADVNARDNNKRTVLHILAAEKKRQKWDSKIVEIILDKPINLNLRDDRQRTALHWAAAMGKIDLVKQLLGRPRLTKPDLAIVTSRGKTALHLACDAMPAVPEIVSLLLHYGADPAAKSDGGWTCLHNSASVQDCRAIIELLMRHHPFLLNAHTSAGMTALHFAAQAGSSDVVACLLEYPECKLNSKDAFGCTAMIRAAQMGHLNIVEQLAPYNNTNRLSKHAIDACNGFDATVVDFRYGSDHQNLVQKYTVFETLYGKDKDGNHSIKTQVGKSRAKTTGQQTQKPGQKLNQKKESSNPKFRWIHLPANNMSWAEDLIAKAFIEEGATDIESFKSVGKAFSQQHKGPTSHSHFMRALCQRSPRHTGIVDTVPVYTLADAPLRGGGSGGITDVASSPERQGRRKMRNLADQSRITQPQPKDSDVKSTFDAQTLVNGRNNGLAANVSITGNAMDESPSEAKPTTGFVKGKKKREVHAKGAFGPGGIAGSGLNRITSFAGSPRQGSMISDSSGKSQTPGTTRAGSHGSNILLFMPYLHFETDERRRRMRDAVRNAEVHRNDPMQSPTSHDEALVWAFLNSSLHLRRTLDQFYLHGIDTEDRDGDQVVGRFCKRKGWEEKLFMVDQILIWILGPGLIITSFPQRWMQPKNDPLNLLDGIIEDINSKTRSPVNSVYDLALLMTARCSGAFDRHQPGDENYQFLDMFESSIGDVNHQETALYKDFYQASATVHSWLSGGRHHNSLHKHNNSTATTPDHRRYPDVVDRFLDIGKETALLQEIKDIREELSMISMVLNQQGANLPALCDALVEDLASAHNHSKVRDAKRRIDDQRKVVDVHLNELTRMGRLAEGIERSLINLLDLKQKQSNAWEARFARDQAAGTVRQGQILLVFTMVTIIFLPMSFLAAFFAIPIKQFPHDDNNNIRLNLGYVSEYIFPIGLGISALLITIAFSVRPLSRAARSIKRAVVELGALNAETSASQEKLIGGDMDLFAIGRFSKEARRSVVSGNMGGSERENASIVGRFSNASFRQRPSKDLEGGGAMVT